VRLLSRGLAFTEATREVRRDDIELYITPGSDKRMRRTDRTGQPCHWILEVHPVDRQRQIGDFYEELLDL
jgi:hypothetical protein